MTIADVFDAVSENRCYRAAMPMGQCFDIIRQGAGQDFDSLLAEVFLAPRWRPFMPRCSEFPVVKRR